jgi:hypothetical protein
LRFGFQLNHCWEASREAIINLLGAIDLAADVFGFPAGMRYLSQLHVIAGIRAYALLMPSLDLDFAMI